MTVEFTPPVEIGKRVPFARTFQALRYRDFRLYWLAFNVSLLGLAFQNVAQGWLVYRLTNSATMLGVTGFVSAILAAPAMIVGGIVADRFSRRSVLVVTQTLLVIPPVVLAYLIWRDQVQVWHVIAATTAMGIIAAIDLPSRTSIVPQLVGPDDILNAQSLSSAARQVTRIAGPVLAGMLIAWKGEAGPYLINGVTYLAMVAAFAAMRPQPAPAQSLRHEGLRSSLLDGFEHIWKSSILLGLFVMAIAQGMFLNSYLTLLPVYAGDILRVGAPGLGWLNTAIGVGALLGALWMANLEQGRRGRVLFVAGLLMPVALTAFAWSQWMGLALPLLMALGGGTVVIRTITTTMFLTVVPDQVRGRVSSLATMVYFGAPYIGGLPAGFLAEHWGAPTALTLAAILFWVSMVIIGLKTPGVRRLE